MRSSRRLLARMHTQLQWFDDSPPHKIIPAKLLSLLWLGGSPESQREDYSSVPKKFSRVTDPHSIVLESAKLPTQTVSRRREIVTIAELRVEKCVDHNFRTSTVLPPPTPILVTTPPPESGRHSRSRAPQPRPWKSLLLPQLPRTPARAPLLRSSPRAGRSL